MVIMNQVIVVGDQEKNNKIIVEQVRNIKLKYEERNLQKKKRDAKHWQARTT
jgi:hypothetical protein